MLDFPIINQYKKLVGRFDNNNETSEFVNLLHKKLKTRTASKTHSECFYCKIEIKHICVTVYGIN